jgi:hypothetical protein
MPLKQQKKKKHKIKSNNDFCVDKKILQEQKSNK